MINKNDIVHWQAYAYDKPIEAEVIEVFKNLHGQIIYKLKGLSKPLLTITTGKSILESDEFIKPTWDELTKSELEYIKNSREHLTNWKVEL